MTRVFDHQELDAVVREILPWGLGVELEGGVAGLVDNTKVPEWRDDLPMPEIGHRLRVVVLDDSRDPVRVSALAKDAEIARRLRG